MDWTSHAERLAGEVTHAVSRWRPVIAAIPRHLFVPRWWSRSAARPGLGSDVWELRDGSADEAGWLRTAYGDQSLVTRVGPLHAGHAGSEDRPVGLPTSSATMPGLIVQLLRHAHIHDGVDILDVGTGSGYGCAVLAQRLGSRHITNIDVDRYLTEVTVERLAGVGLRPQVTTGDATGPLSGSYDRIVSTVAVRPIPASWLAALWEIWSMLGIVAPGIEHHYQQDGDGRRAAWMLHSDGSWARATSVDGEAPTVHQRGSPAARAGAPRRQPRRGRLSLGQAGEVERHQVVPGRRGAGAAVGVLGELELVVSSGQAKYHAVVPGVPLKVK